jgi:predicted nucleic acid-binding protein
MAVLIDSGFLFAVLSESDISHVKAVRVLGTIREEVILLVPAITEVAYLLARNLGSEAAAAFIDRLAYTELTLENPVSSDYSRAATLIRQYADARLDFIDALIVAVAERLNIKRLLTVDQRDFGMIRPTHCAAFELLP